MGCFDTVIVPCPECGNDVECQSKGGSCSLQVFSLHDAPLDVMSDVNRHAPHLCTKCGHTFSVSGKHARLHKECHVHHEYEKRVMRILNEIKWDFDQGEYSSAVLRLRPLEVELVELNGTTNKIADTYDQF